MVNEAACKFHRSTLNEKESHNCKQHEKEKNSRVFSEDVYQGRQINLEQKTCKGEKKIDRLALKKAVHDNTILW